MNDTDYVYAIRQIKEHVKISQQQAVLTVNVRLLFLYWEIGGFIISQKEKLGWGAKVISRISKDLKHEFPEMKGFSSRNLKYMVAFAETFSDKQLMANTNTKVQALPAQLQSLPALLKTSISLYDFIESPASKITWSHHMVLMDKTSKWEAYNYYMNKAISEGWSYRVLKHKVEQKLFESQGTLPNNFDKTLPPVQSELAKQTLKDEYIFDFLSLKNEAKEKDIENALLKEITAFLLELGNGFAFLGQQYHLQIGGQDYYLDLLFYHVSLNCYFIIELKIDDFKPEYAGKMNFYLNAADDLLKLDHHQPTVGLLLCKSANAVIAEYSLRDNNKPIGVSTYKLLPKKEELIALLKSRFNT